MFGIAQQTYAFQKLQYATELGKEYGIRILASMDDAPAERQMEILDRLEGSLQLSLNTVAPSLNAVGDAVEMIRTLGGARLAQIRFQDYAADSEGFVTKETSRPGLAGPGSREDRSLRRRCPGDRLFRLDMFRHTLLQCGSPDSRRELRRPGPQGPGGPGGPVR